MKFQRVILFFLGVAFLGLCGAPPLSAASSADFQELQNEVSTLKRMGEKNNQDLAKTMNLLTQIQTQFQSIKGQIDASRFLTQETDRVYRDLDVRVSSLEDKIDQIHNLLKEMVTSQKAGGPPQSSHNQEYADFQSLLTMVNNRDYQAAASGFLGFVRKYPKSQYVPRALFWTGECFYFMGDFARSIKEFQKLVEKYPQDIRVQEAIYRQGLAFTRLKKYPEAKLFFQKVMASYPNTATAAKAQTRLHRIEEMEKNQVALGESSEGEPKEAKKPRPEVSADKPITKISPYGPKGQPPSVSGEDKTPPAPEEGARPEPSQTQQENAPLF